MTVHDLFWKMVKELQRVKVAYREVLERISDGTYSHKGSSYVALMSEAITKQAYELDEFEKTFDLEHLREDVEIFRELRHRFEMWRIARDKGIQAAMLYKLGMDENDLPK